MTKILNGKETSPARARTRNIVLSDHPVAFGFHPGGSAPVLHKQEDLHKLVLATPVRTQQLLVNQGMVQNADRLQGHPLPTAQA